MGFPAYVARSSQNKITGTIAHLSDKKAIGKHLESSLQSLNGNKYNV